MNTMNFLRVAAVVPEMKIANPEYNSDKICQLWDEIDKEQVDILVFPELGIPGYSCGDLFTQKALYDNSLLAIEKIVRYSEEKNSILIVGSYLNIENKLYNCSFVVYKGSILAAIPKIHLANKQDSYEKRWFTSGKELNIDETILFNKTLPIGNIVLSDINSAFSFSTEISQDLWAPLPPSSFLYLQGAELIFNLAASSGEIEKTDYRRDLITQQSARFNGGYIYASAGVYESTTDSLMDGHALIAENGKVLKENERFQRKDNYIINDIDLELLKSQRLNNSFLKNLLSFFKPL